MYIGTVKENRTYVADFVYVICVQTVNQIPYPVFYVSSTTTSSLAVCLAVLSWQLPPHPLQIFNIRRWSVI